MWNKTKRQLIFNTSSGWNISPIYCWQLAWSELFLLHVIGTLIPQVLTLEVVKMDRLRLVSVNVRSSQLEMKFVKIIYMQYWNFNFPVQGSSLHLWGPYYRTLREKIGVQKILKNKRTYKSPFRAKTFRNWKIKKWLALDPFLRGRKIGKWDYL